jgi:hypothetical protein
LSEIANLFAILDNIDCAQQFESQLSLRSLARYLNNIGCARQSQASLPLFSLARYFRNAAYLRFFAKSGANREKKQVYMHFP